MGVDLYAYQLKGGLYDFAPSIMFEDLPYVDAESASIRLSMPYRELLIADAQVMTRDDLESKLFTPDEHGRLLQYLNANPCPSYLTDLEYRTFIEFVARAFDYDLTLSIG